MKASRLGGRLVHKSQTTVFFHGELGMFLMKLVTLRHGNETQLRDWKDISWCSDTFKSTVRKQGRYEKNTSTPKSLCECINLKGSHHWYLQTVSGINNTGLTVIVVLARRRAMRGRVKIV